MTICERQSGGRILCIRLSGLGDVVHSLNALSLLRAERPDAHITWIVEERFAGLLRDHPCIDELITVPRKVWARMLRNPFRWPGLSRELSRFARRLREARFDVSVDFQSSFKSAWLVRAAWAPVRIGFDRPISRELNWSVQNVRVRVPGRGVHRIERDIALLGPLGIRARVAEAVLPVAPAARRALLVALRGRLTGGPLVVMHPGTSRFAAFKRWDPARYARLADALIEARGADVIVSSGPEDRDMAEEVVRLMRRQPVEAPPTAGLDDLSALLARADLFIGSDTGPMHMAGALGVPVVSLFGPKDAVQTGPYTSRSIVVTADVACRPCTRRRCPHARCMSAIPVHRVVRAARDVLDGGGKCRAQPGLLRKPFTHAFKLGDWRGRVTSAYSYAEFFTRLCEPDELVAGTGRAPAGAVPETPVGRAPREGDGTPRLAVRRCTMPEAARRGSRFRIAVKRAWRRALALVLDGVPTPFPACRLQREPAWRGDTLLLTEEIEGAVSLREWSANARGTDARERSRVIEAVAALMQSLHGAGWCGPRLKAEDLLVRQTVWHSGPPLCPHPEGAGAAQPQSGPGGTVPHWEAFAGAPERLLPTRWLPLFARDVLAAADVRHLAASAGVPLSVRDGVRFLRAYWQGAEPPRHRRRLIVRLLKPLVRNPLKTRSQPHG